MSMYLGSNKVAVTKTIETHITSMKAFFDAGGRCAYSLAENFKGCWQIEDTANVIEMSNMFRGCYNLREVPQFSTREAGYMDAMFQGCPNIKTVPLFNTSQVTRTDNMFNGCSSLTTVPKFDMSRVHYMLDMFKDCTSLETIHMININADLDISASTKFTREALMEIIGNLKAQASGTKTLTMGETNLAKLTEEDKKIATDKGWTLA